MLRSVSWSCLLVSLLLPSVFTYEFFKSKIPNGYSVKHPCKANFIWKGVGHKQSAGGGARNDFGEDFDDAGKTWTKELCGKDSDGDGRSNGEELGDPDCTWTEGQIPARVDHITHPGVCEPFDSAECKPKNTWVDCSADEVFDCDYIKASDVRNMTIRFPRTKVPAAETTYICFNFQLPDDKEYHLIATEPLINNSNVMHHMVLMGCKEQGGMLNEPVDCMMGMKGCSDSISIWTLGMAGECMNPQAGFKIGKGGITTVALQHHWTNPELKDDYYDSSGLILYYTEKLRPHNAGVFTIGQLGLTIPPGLPSITFNGDCPGVCTRRLMKGPIHIVSALNHMHYLGTRQNATMQRPGQKAVTLTDDNPYSYDSPHVYKYDKPMILYPGDKLNTKCTYQSRSRETTTNYGAGSFDEMCFAIFTYYPAENLTNNGCFQRDDYQFCTAEECNYSDIFNSSAPKTKAMIDELLQSCNAAGKCQPECPMARQKLLKENPCYHDMWEFIADTIFLNNDAKLIKFVTAMRSCENKSPMTTARPAYDRTTMPSYTYSPFVNDPSAMLLGLVKQLDNRPLLQNIIMNVNYNNMASSMDHDDHEH